MSSTGYNDVTITPLDDVAGGKDITPFYSFCPMAPKNSSYAGTGIGPSL